jgi:transcriptional regulator with XRE-family HTH domain
MDQNPASAAPRRLKAGDKLRRFRSQMGITAREVEELSRIIAAEQSNEEFIISHGRIIQVENDESTPSIYKLCSLSAIYDIPLDEMVSMFVDMDSISKYRHKLKKDQTRLVRVEIDQPGKPLAFPVRFDPGFSVDKTNLLSRLVQVWGELPMALLQHMNLRSMQYGLVGLTDFTMSPMLTPGSFVQIDDSQRKIVNVPSTSEFERPIYFIELRDGFLCGWCEMQKNQILVIPHPLSPCKVRVFSYPNEADIIGRVVAVAARIAPIREPQAGAGSPPERAPKLPQSSP